MVTYRLLPPSEWERVRSIFRSLGGDLPQPGMAFIFVGEEDGEIVATGAMEGILHAGYLWVKPQLRGRFVWNGLKRAFEDTFELKPGEHYSIFTTNVQAEAVARRVGSKLLPIKVWRKDV